MKTKGIVLGLALGSLAFAILMPPEAYPAGKMALLLCSTFAFLAALIEKRIPNAYLAAGLTIFSLLLLHSFFLSVDVFRSVEFVTVLWAYYCVMGFFMYSGEETMKPVAITMVALAIFVSAYGLYQYFWGFDEVYRYLFYAASDEVVKIPALDRVATRRVFSTLALPGTLWGFLLITLPFHALLWRRHRALDVLLVTSATLLLAAGFLTRSFGFLVGLFCLIACWLAFEHRRILWNRLTVALLLLVIAGGTFYSARRDLIEGSNPMALRFRNWVSAWHIFAVHPAGTGLNTYGVVYPQYMLPGANETQYAHNTALQLLSELGYPLVFAVVALFVFLAAHAKPKLSDKGLRYVLLALIVWGIHNMIDINVYFGSVGAVGAALIGLLFSGKLPDRIVARQSLTIATAVFGIAAVGVGALVFLSDELQHRAQIEYENNKLVVAIETLDQAKMMMPFNSSLYHDAGEILLDASQKFKNPDYLRQANETFRRAIQLSPEKVGPHIGLGLCLSQAGDVDGALSEIALAHGLYPRSDYVRSVARLIEQRKGR